MNMFKEIIADLKAMDQSPSVMRKFGLVSGFILAVLGGLSVFSHRADPQMISNLVIGVWIAAGFFILMALVLPTFLKPVNSVMVVIALTIGWFVTRIALFLLFFLVFFPMGIFLRIIGKDSLRRKIDEKADTYWIDRSDETFDPARCRRLF